jgi:hypothetical protein
VADRLPLALLTLLGGVVLSGGILVALARTPGQAPGGDWSDYRTAALRLLDHRSPYADAMFVGPVPAQGTDRYRYPPLLAQVVVPLATPPPGLGLAAWSAVLVGLVLLGTWLAVLAAGTGAGPSSLAWTAAGVAWFLPTVATLWTGNASATFAVAVGAALFAERRAATGRASSGAAVAIAFTALSRLAPFALLPATLRRGGRLAMVSVVALGALAAVSVLLAPSAWRDYLTVLPNLLAGNAQFSNNLAPDAVVVGSGAPPAVGVAVRGASLVAGGALIVASYRIAAPHRIAARGAAWPAAVTAGVIAGLLIPPVLWYHYLTALLPVAAFAWLRGGQRARLAIAASAGLVDVGLALPAIGALGAGCLAGTSLAGLWPRGEPRSAAVPA